MFYKEHFIRNDFLTNLILEKIRNRLVDFQKTKELCSRLMNFLRNSKQVPKGLTYWKIKKHGKVPICVSRYIVQSCTKLLGT